MNDYLNDYGEQPRTVERVRRSPMWPVLVLIVGLVAVVMHWPFLYEFVTSQASPGGRPETARTEPESVKSIPGVEGRDEKTHEEGPVTPTPLPEKTAPPASIADQPRPSPSLGAYSPATISNPASASLGDNLKGAVEAITMDGIFVERLRDADDSLTILGYADANKTIADYLRRLQREVGNPLLEMSKREERHGKMISRFSIRLRK